MRMGEADFDKVIEVNLKSVFNMTKAVQRTMLKQRKGIYYQHEFGRRREGKCRANQLCRLQSRYYRIFKICRLRAWVKKY